MALRGDDTGIFLFKKVNNTKYIRKVKDMKNSPNKENTPCVKQWSRCNCLKGVKVRRVNDEMM
jgi:hypothetical protein